MEKSVQSLNPWKVAVIFLSVFIISSYLFDQKNDKTECDCSLNEPNNDILLTQSTLLDSVISKSVSLEPDSPKPNSTEPTFTKPDSSESDSSEPDSASRGGGNRKSKQSSASVSVPDKQAIPTETGAWKLGKGYNYFLDKNLVEALGEIFYNQTVLELGAGKGRYTEALKAKVSAISGYDGAPNVEEETNGFIKWADLTERQELGLHDWVMCLEVGEHVPAQFELMVIDNIHRHNTKGVVLSWAVPEQGGNGHVNNHSNRYIRNLMKALGYKYSIKVDNDLRHRATLKWFKETLMVFRKEEAGEREL